MCMQKPPIPAFERERLDSLTSYRIMDSEREKEYDGIAELASYICGTPVSLVTFIDDERQWFKAAVGTEFTENTRDDSFCTFVLPEPDELLVIPDATADERFHNNPLVINSPNVKFYAGVSLKSREGLPIGTLCVLDVKPNQLNEQQQKALRTLAGQTSKLLELRRKNIEIKTAAKQNQTELQAKIDERTTELKDKNFRLERANEEIKRLIYTASHDLKEPVRKLKIYTDLLNTTESGPGRAKELSGKINGYADHIEDLINDIGIFSNINLNDVKAKPVDLNEVINAVLNQHESRITEFGASVTLGKLPVVNGDHTQFYQLFENLLTNALKYANGKPKIECHYSIVNGEDINTDAGNLPSQQYHKIDFKDYGIGIEEVYINKIFDFLSRLHTRQKYEGNGIGLAIVKKVVLNHNGWVSVSSKLGEETIFSVYLPKSG